MATLTFLNSQTVCCGILSLPFHELPMAPWKSESFPSPAPQSPKYSLPQSCTMRPQELVVPISSRNNFENRNRSIEKHIVIHLGIPGLTEEEKSTLLLDSCIDPWLAYCLFPFFLRIQIFEQRQICYLLAAKNGADQNDYFKLLCL